MYTFSIYAEPNSKMELCLCPLNSLAKYLRLLKSAAFTMCLLTVCLLKRIVTTLSVESFLCFTLKQQYETGENKLKESYCELDRWISESELKLSIKF